MRAGAFWRIHEAYLSLPASRWEVLNGLSHESRLIDSVDFVEVPGRRGPSPAKQEAWPGHTPELKTFGLPVRWAVFTHQGNWRRQDHASLVFGRLVDAGRWSMAEREGFDLAFFATPLEFDTCLYV